MRIKLIFLIPVLAFIIVCNQEKSNKNKLVSQVSEKKDVINKVITDTITNWQFYKDSDLLFKSNMLNSNLYTAEIKKSDEYKKLILKFFYDIGSHNEIVEREMRLVINGKVFANFKSENTTHAPFPMEKYILDRIRMVKPNKKLEIVYYDPIHKNGIRIGFLKLTNK